VVLWHTDGALHAPDLGPKRATDCAYRGAEGEVEDRYVGGLCFPQLPHTHLGTCREQRLQEVVGLLDIYIETACLLPWKGQWLVLLRCGMCVWVWVSMLGGCVYDSMQPDRNHKASS